MNEPDLVLDPLTVKLQRTILDAARNDVFDIDAELAAILGDIGFGTADAGGSVRFEGRDPIVPSTLRLGGASALGLMQQSVVAAKLHRLRGGPGQDVSINLAQAIRRLAPMTERRWELINGFPPIIEDPAIRLLLSFYRTADGRQVLPANLYPRLKSAMLAELRCWDDPTAIARAFLVDSANAWEDRFEAKGLVLCKVRTLEEFLAEPIYDYLCKPLIAIEKISDGTPEPLPPVAAMPLSGVRALGMGHVIAGAGCGRSLASLGADVLNIWRPMEFEQESIYVTANVGMRSCRLDPRSMNGRDSIATLLRDADIFFANRRPGLLAEFDLDAEQAAEIRPGIVHVTMSTHGREGPWARRPGFDQLAGAVTGMLCLEGSADAAALPPTVIVNDYLVAWLAATGAMAALHRRATEGGSFRVHVSLTRVALWILSLGIFEKDYALATAGQSGAHALIAPELFEADTPLGRYQGVSETVRMSATPRRFDPVLVPRGSSRADWLSR